MPSSPRGTDSRCSTYCAVGMPLTRCPISPSITVFLVTHRLLLHRFEVLQFKSMQLNIVQIARSTVCIDRKMQFACVEQSNLYRVGCAHIAPWHRFYCCTYVSCHRNAPPEASKSIILHRFSLNYAVYIASI